VYYIALDEVGQNLVVTYLYVDARYNLTPQKKMVFLKPEDKQKILQAAYARRQKPVQPQSPVQSATRFFQ
jgi:hypothetical protein